MTAFMTGRMGRIVRHGAGFLHARARAANIRLALPFAFAGMVAMMVPFVVLLELGRPEGAVFAALGGLNTILADVGSAYRNRLLAMLIALLVGTAGLFIGSIMPAATWIAPPVFAAVIFIVGMARVFGAPGVAAGMFAGIMFLIGLVSPQAPLRAAVFAGYCLAGGLWTVFFVLVMWRARPHRFLFLQLAACFEGCAELVAGLVPEFAGTNPAVLRRRMRRRYRATREAILTTQATLADLRLAAGQSNPVFDRALMLLDAASREAVAATSLRAMDWPAPGTPAARAWQNLFASWQAALASVARRLVNDRGEIKAAPFHAAFAALEAQVRMSAEARAPLLLALLHLDAIAQADARASGAHFAWREALPRLGFGGLRDAWATLGAQFTFRSIIFRHALRVAVAAGFGLWISGVFDVNHRLWLPLTTIIVLQPEFGATWRRLWQRVGGTLAGVLIAGGLYFLVHGTAAELVIIAIFAFATFFFIRTHYGVGVVMLTPMVVLLLGVLTPGAAGSLIVARCVDTLLGGVLALAAAYLLWPLWQRGAFLPQCAAAVRAYRDYLAIAFVLPGDGRLSHPELMQARLRAERENDNADATLHKMLSEPRRERGDVRAALGFMTYLRRLADNAVRFAVELGGDKLSPGERGQGNELLCRLDAVADTLADETAAREPAPMRPQLAVATPDVPLVSRFERLSADTGMLAAAASKLRRSDARNS